MLFQQVKNHSQPSQDQKNRKTRQDFHKKIRKQMIDKKISSMRRSLLMNIKQSEQKSQTGKVDEQFLTQFDECFLKKLQQSCQVNSENMRTIMKSLSILSKFNRINIQNTSTIEMRKYSKKIDAIICLLMSIDEWIMQDKAKVDIQADIKLKESIQMQNENLILADQSELDNLKPLTWTQKQQNKQSKMQILRELIMLVLFEKLTDYLGKLKQNISQSNDSGNTAISDILMKWLFFYQTNMKLFYQTSHLSFKQTIQQFNSDLFSQTIVSYYFQVIFMVLKLIPLNLISQIFFNSIEKIPYFNPNEEGISDHQRNTYISSSPFQFLIENQNHGQRFIFQLEKQMKTKIQEKDMILCIRKMKSLSLKNQENLDQIHQLTNQEIQLEKAKALLSTVSKRLLNLKKRNYIKQKHDFYS